MTVVFDDAVLFDAERHRYTHDGVDLPSVTTVLKCWSPISKVPDWKLEDARLRGELVHAATAFLDEDDLDLSSVDDEVMGYLEGWRKFRRDYSFVPTMIERRLAHLRWGYAGTPDRFGEWAYKGYVRSVLIDIKTGFEDPTHGPQTAAYAQAIQDSGTRVTQRATVYLSPGDYRVETYTGMQDWTIFMAALQWHRWKQRHGL
jgi:hypothetical protein